MTNRSDLYAPGVTYGDMDNKMKNMAPGAQYNNGYGTGMDCKEWGKNHGLTEEPGGRTNYGDTGSGPKDQGASTQSGNSLYQAEETRSLVKEYTASRETMTGGFGGNEQTCKACAGEVNYLGVNKEGLLTEKAGQSVNMTTGTMVAALSTGNAPDRGSGMGMSGA